MDRVANENCWEEVLLFTLGFTFALLCYRDNHIQNHRSTGIAVKLHGATTLQKIKSLPRRHYNRNVGKCLEQEEMHSQLVGWPSLYAPG